MGNMGSAAVEAAEHELQWREMAINEWGHSVNCKVFQVGGECDCDKPNLPEKREGRGGTIE